MKVRQIVSPAEAAKSKRYRKLSLRQLHDALGEIIDALENPPHQLNDLQFSALMQWLKVRRSVSAEQLALVTSIAEAVKHMKYPKPVEGILLYELDLIPDDEDYKARDRRLAEVRKHLTKQAAGQQTALDGVQLPTDERMFHRSERWGKKVWEEEADGPEAELE